MICLLLNLAAVFAQSDSHRQFTAASIKPSAPDARNTMIGFPPGGRVEIGNMTLKEMIAKAYSIQTYQISGGPAWLDSVHYDVSAKSGADLKRDQVFLLLQSLLIDRFHLVARREVRQLPIYALVPARKDGKPGPRLIESRAGACTQPDPVNPFAVDPSRLCGNFELSPENLTLVSASISSVTPMLSGLLGRTVVDRTGLTKNYDVEIEWTPDESIAMKLPPGVRPEHPTGPSIFTVFRDQLGIAFHAEKGPVEIFVIERADKASEN
jgi:uncharacterized protein (TIGR03435 family)